MNDGGANATEERMFSAIMHHLFGYGTENRSKQRYGEACSANGNIDSTGNGV